MDLPRGTLPWAVCRAHRILIAHTARAHSYVMYRVTPGFYTDGARPRAVVLLLANGGTPRIRGAVCTAHARVPWTLERKAVREAPRYQPRCPLRRAAQLRDSPFYWR